jgi:hypothetical protein
MLVQIHQQNHSRISPSLCWLMPFGRSSLVHSSSWPYWVLPYMILPRKYSSILLMIFNHPISLFMCCYYRIFLYRACFFIVWSAISAGAWGAAAGIYTRIKSHNTCAFPATPVDCRSRRAIEAVAWAELGVFTLILLITLPWLVSSRRSVVSIFWVLLSSDGLTSIYRVHQRHKETPGRGKYGEIHVSLTFALYVRLDIFIIDDVILI